MCTIVRVDQHGLHLSYLNWSFSVHVFQTWLEFKRFYTLLLMKTLFSSTGSFSQTQDRRSIAISIANVHKSSILSIPLVRLLNYFSRCTVFTRTRMSPVPVPRLSDSKGAFQIRCIYYWTSSSFSIAVYVQCVYKYIHSICIKW